MPSKVLVVGSFSKLCYTFTAMLRQRGFEPISATTVEDARPLLQQDGPALVICIAELLDGTYHDILKTTAVTSRPVPVVVIACKTDDSEYQRAMALGAADYVPSSLSPEHAAATIDKAVALIAGKKSLPRQLSSQADT